MQKVFRAEKMNQLQKGFITYAESSELIRLIKRDISKMSLNVFIEETPSGCWFTPLHSDLKEENRS